MNNTWKKTVAFVMALTIVAGAAPTDFGGFINTQTSIVAYAAEYTSTVSTNDLQEHDIIKNGATLTRSNNFDTVEYYSNTSARRLGSVSFGNNGWTNGVGDLIVESAATDTWNLMGTTITYRTITLEYYIPSTVAMTGWTYGSYNATTNAPSISYTEPSNYKSQNVTYTYFDANGNEISANNLANANAGNYTVKAVSKITTTVTYSQNGKQRTADVQNYMTVATGTFTIAKATPEYTAPTNLTATYGQKLSNIVLPNGWAWDSPDTSVGDAGTRTFSATFTPNNTTNYNTVQQNLTVNVGKANPTVTAPTPTNPNFTGSPLALVTAGSTSAGTMQYSLDNQTWSTDIPEGTNAGPYTVYYRVVGNDNYNDVAANSVTSTIAKVDSSIATAPAAKQNLKYTASLQDLVTAGEANGGTVWYKIGTDGAYSTAIPKAENAGNYNVYYKVVGDGNHNGIDNTSAMVIPVSISQETPTLTVSMDDWTYGEIAETPIISTTNGLNYTTLYTGTTFGGEKISSNEVPSQAGNYTITVSTEGNNNYTAHSASADFTIAKADIAEGDITLPTAISNLEYSNEDKNLVTAGSVTGNIGTFYYSLDNVNWSTDIPTGRNAGNYTVYYKVVGDSNHNNITYDNSIPVNIATIDPVYTAPTANNQTYTGQSLKLVTAGSTNDGTIYYRLDDDVNWSEDVPQAINAGSYTVYWYLDGDDNHNNLGSADEPHGTINVSTSTAGMNVSIENYEGVYDGEEHGITINVTSPEGATVLYSEDGESYSETPIKRQDAGETTVYYKVEKANYTTKEGSATIKISQKSIANANVKISNGIDSATEFEHTGSLIEPVFTVELDGNTLATDDYEVSGNTSEKEIGNSYKITVTGKGNYKDSADASWQIIGEEAIIKRYVTVSCGEASATIDNGGKVSVTATANSNDDTTYEILRTGFVYCNSKDKVSDGDLILEKADGVDVKSTTPVEGKVGSADIPDNGYGMKLRAYADVLYKGVVYHIYSSEVKESSFKTLVSAEVASKVSVTYDAPKATENEGNRVVVTVNSSTENPNITIVKTGIIYFNADGDPINDDFTLDKADGKIVKVMNPSNGNQKKGQILDKGFGITARGYSVVSCGGIEFVVYGKVESYSYENLKEPTPEEIAANSVNVEYSGLSIGINQGNRVILQTDSSLKDGVTGYTIKETGAIYYNESTNFPRELTYESVGTNDIKKIKSTTAHYKKGQFLDKGYGVAIRGYAIVEDSVGTEFTVYGEQVHYSFADLAQEEAQSLMNITYSEPEAKENQGNRVVLQVNSAKKNDAINILETGMIYYNASENAPEKLTYESINNVTIKKIRSTTANSKKGQFLDNGYGVEGRGYAIVEYLGLNLVVYGEQWNYKYADLLNQGEPLVVVPEVVAVQSITLSETSLNLQIDWGWQLTATVYPHDASDQTVTWTSSNPGVVSIEQDGSLAAYEPGSATITAIAGGQSATCEITVYEPEPW